MVLTKNVKNTVAVNITNGECLRKANGNQTLWGWQSIGQQCITRRESKISWLHGKWDAGKEEVEQERKSEVGWQNGVGEVQQNSWKTWRIENCGETWSATSPAMAHNDDDSLHKEVRSVKIKLN